MDTVLTITSDKTNQQKETLKQIYEFRHKIFYERLNWEVQSHNGMEIDRFDEMSPVHMACRDARRQIAATFRLLPTTGPYMLKDIFPQLLAGEAPPRDPNIWEISRFASETSTPRNRVQAGLGAETFAMIQNLLPFAEEHGIRHYVFATSVAVERLLARIGLPMRRFGEGRARRIGKVLSVACWLDVDERFRNALSAAPRKTVSGQAA